MRWQTAVMRAPTSHAGGVAVVLYQQLLKAMHVFFHDAQSDTNADRLAGRIAILLTLEGYTAMQLAIVAQ